MVLYSETKLIGKKKISKQKVMHFFKKLLVKWFSVVQMEEKSVETAKLKVYIIYLSFYFFKSKHH